MQPVDQTKTAPFSMGPGASETRTAVLLIHGFTGSPWEVRPVAEALAPRGFHVRTMRLPGHGTTPEAMLWVTWREWLSAVDAELDALAEFTTVVVGGLSMGGLLGLITAARRSDRVHGLVMMAPALQLQSKRAMALKLTRRFNLSGIVPSWITKDGSDIEQPEIRAQSPVLPRYPSARLKDLFALQDLAQSAESRLRCPSLLLASRYEHVVDFNAIVALHGRIPNSRLVVLNRGWHIIPRDTDRSIAISEIAQFVESIAAQRKKVTRLPNSRELKAAP